MKRKLISPPIHENGGYSPLFNIEGLVELEPENGCFASSRMRDESRISKGNHEHTQGRGHESVEDTVPPQESLGT